MEKKFTPGKWVAANERNNTGNFSIETNDRWPIYIAQTISCDSEKANAQLLSACPDLLEALEDIISLAECAYEHSFTSEEDEDITDRIHKAKQAIKKSYGIK